jgi:hypothetical protein
LLLEPLVRVVALVEVETEEHLLLLGLVPLAVVAEQEIKILQAVTLVALEAGVTVAGEVVQVHLGKAKTVPPHQERLPGAVVVIHKQDKLLMAEAVYRIVGKVRRTGMPGVAVVLYQAVRLVTVVLEAVAEVAVMIALLILDQAVVVVTTGVMLQLTTVVMAVLILAAVGEVPVGIIQTAGLVLL